MKQEIKRSISAGMLVFVYFLFLFVLCPYLGMQNQSMYEWVFDTFRPPIFFGGLIYFIYRLRKAGSSEVKLQAKNSFVSLENKRFLKIVIALQILIEIVIASLFAS